MKVTLRLKGGPGSGHHGHKGIPGHQGGSADDEKKFGGVQRPNPMAGGAFNPRSTPLSQQNKPDFETAMRADKADHVFAEKHGWMYEQIGGDYSLTHKGKKYYIAGTPIGGFDLKEAGMFGVTFGHFKTRTDAAKAFERTIRHARSR